MKNAHGFCFAVLCCGYTLTDFPISIRLTSLALWQSNDCPSASKATLMNMDEYFMWIHYERLHNHNKAKHNKTVCIFLGIYCICVDVFIFTLHNGDYNNPAKYTICHPDDSLSSIIAYPITHQVVQSITTVARLWRCTLYRQLKINSKWCNGIDFFYGCPTADFQTANDSSKPRATGQY